MASPDSLDALFSSGSWDDGSETPDAPLVSSISKIGSFQARRLSCQIMPPSKTRIESLSDATPRITAFLSILSDFHMPDRFHGELFFIPEGVVPDDMTRLLNEFNRTRDKSIIDSMEAFDKTKFPEAILAQLDLVRSLKDDTVDLTFWVEKRLDARILSLVHFGLTKSEDPAISAFHAISAIEEIVKFPSLAPISVFFEDFSLQNLIVKLAGDLVTLFRHNPILPSVIHNLSEYAPEIRQDFDSIVEQDSNECSDWSEGFLDSLQQMQETQNASVFSSMFQTEIMNPLSLENELPKSITTINEPPTTATYLLADGSDRMSPMKFQEWILSIRCERQEALKQVQGQEAFKSRKIGSHRRDKSTNSDPLVGLTMNSEEMLVKAEDWDLSSLYNELEDPESIIRQMPSLVPLDEVSLYLPLVHMLNASRPMAFTTGFPYPKPLLSEFDAHIGLVNNDATCVSRSLAYFSSLVSKELKEESQRVVFESLKQKRNPAPMIVEAPKTLLAAIGIADYEFVCRGRSPFTGATIGMATNEQKDLLLSNSIVRAKLLYHLYVKENFSPYIAFRLAFALALNLMESDPWLASELLFEGIYILVESMKQMRRMPFVRFAFLCLADILDRLGSFYYAVMVLDNFFLGNVRDFSSSTAVAQMCSRNRDYLRAAFHYTQGLRNYVKTARTQEALYVAQILSGIYIDGGLQNTAISLLAYLLYKSYSISSGNYREKSTAVTFGSLKMAHPKRICSGPLFLPNPKSLNTILLAVKLIGLLIDRHMFDVAELLLEKVEESAANTAVQKLTKFSRAQLYLKRNSFPELLAAIPRLNLSASRNASAHLSLLTASSFDSTAGSIKLLAIGYLARRCFVEGVFWAEMYIFSSARSSLKEIGYGYLLRGTGLTTAYKRGLANVEFTDDLPCNGNGSKIGAVIRKSLTRHAVFLEALASYSMARQCFERVGAIRLQVKAYLAYADLLMTKMSSNHSEKFFEVAPPGLITEPIGVRRTNSAVTGVAFTADLETFGQSFSVMEPLITKLMNPLDVMLYQICAAKYNFLKGRDIVSKSYFDYAFDNLTRYFCCGSEFVPVQASIRKLTRFHILVEHFCDLLINFDTDYINSHLIVFDIMNDIRHLWQTRLKEPTPQNNDTIFPSIDITDQLFELTNPHLPEFKSLLIENGYVDKREEILDAPTICDMMRQLSANIRLFESGKLTEDEMILKNTKLCRRIETCSETIRRQKSSQIPVETDFSFALRSCPKVENCVFVQRVFDKLIVYVPNTGEKRIVNMLSHPKKVTLRDEDETRDVSITIVPKEVTKFMFSLLGSKTKTCSAKDFSDLRERLFGDLVSSFPTFEPVSDDHPLGKGRTFRKSRGSLASLSCGNNPVVLIPSTDMQAIPFELILPDCCVVRSMNYSALLRRPPSSSMPKPTILKSFFEDSRPPFDAFFDAMFAAGAELQPTPAVKRHLSQLLPFSTKKDSTYYTRKYPFVDVVTLPQTEVPRLSNGSSVLLILDYKDLYGMPGSLVKVFKDYPFAAFMFIPRPCVKNALCVMAAIIQRHMKREAYFKKHKDEHGAEFHMAVLSDGFTGVTAIQATLMRELKVPIPIFVSI